VRALRQHAGGIASRLHGRPSRRLRVIGVTGTNGKTTCSQWIAQALTRCGRRCAVIGTLGYGLRAPLKPLVNTTPDALWLHAQLAEFARRGAQAVAMEVSSIGLDQDRVAGVEFDTALFTNLSRDHLDYHPTMDAYFAAKMRLFDEVVVADGTAVVWTGDAKSGDVIEHVRRRGLKLVTVGPGAETIELVSRASTPLGQQLVLRHEGREHKLSLPLIGAYQMNNVLTAAGLVLATGGDWATTLSGMARVSPVRGRLERAVISRSGAPVYVDYAHTPDAIEAAIAALRPHVEGRLITVLGAGGDRDEGKRPEMGAVAARLSDVVIVTDDNPRSEEPAAIRRAVLAGAPDAIEVGDRRAAIGEAIAMAKAGDIVLVAGKGHEQGQIIGDQVLPFDDVTVARECAA
jgi:UDP-N-acetylmuramoyl-L-alanyl-D-glutamate--2,6-diaminopimelate ligase